MAKNIQVSLSPERVALAPGDTAEFTVVIHNTSDVVEAYSIEVQGITPSWTRLSVSSVSLFPGDKESVLVTINPPVSVASKAGSYAVSVKVASKRDPAVFTSASFILDLGKIAEYELELSPKRLKGRKGPYQVIITNNGNTTSTYKLEATDPDDMCDFRFRSDTVAVEPGATTRMPLTINPRKKPFTGESRPYSFTVTATPVDGEAKTVDGDFECRALVPKWALVVAGLVLIGLIVLIVIMVMTGGGVDLPVRDKFGLKPGAFQSYEFSVNDTVSIEADVTWTGAAERVSVLLVGPDGLEKSRLEDAGPLNLSYEVTNDDLAASGSWMFYVANLSDAREAEVTLHLRAEALS